MPKHYLVVGRLYGDDEVTTRIYTGMPTARAACTAFANDHGGSLKTGERPDMPGDGFIDEIFESETQISVTEESFAL